MHQPLTLVSGEEVGFVATINETFSSFTEARQYDRSRDGAAELVSLEDVAGQSINIIEKRIRIERVIAQKLKDLKMNVIGARLCNHANDSTAVASIFSSVVAFEDAKLGDGVGIRVKNKPVIQQIIVYTAVQQIGNRITSAACNGETLAPATIARICLSNTWLQECQLHHITPVEW